MLIAMLTVFLLGGGPMGGLILNPAEVEALAERAEQTIEDPVRVVAATALLDELEREVKGFDEIFVESGAELGKIFRDHKAGSRPMLKALERLNLEWYAAQNRSIKLRTLLRESVTAAEWAMIFGAE